MAGETSFATILIRMSQGDRSLVGFRSFAIMVFATACFFVQRGSALETLKDLSGKRIGVNAWPDTGTPGPAQAVREQGVHLEDIQWFVGRIDDTRRPSRRCGGRTPYVHPGRGGVICATVDRGRTGRAHVPSSAERLLRGQQSHCPSL